jgi:hypothetical protein
MRVRAAARGRFAVAIASITPAPGTRIESVAFPDLD